MERVMIQAGIERGRRLRAEAIRRWGARFRLWLCQQRWGGCAGCGYSPLCERSLRACSYQRRRLTAEQEEIMAEKERVTRLLRQRLDPNR